jgi:hypothetical protein
MRAKGFLLSQLDDYGHRSRENVQVSGIGRSLRLLRIRDVVPFPPSVLVHKSLSFKRRVRIQWPTMSLPESRFT